MLFSKTVLVSLFIALPYVFTQGNYFTSESDPVIVPKGYHGERNFGDLTTAYTIDSSGKNALCTLYVSTVLAGIETLTATNPVYNFDVKVGLGAASGSLSLQLADTPRVSKLQGNFTYTVTGNNTSFTFKGDLVGWYTRN